MMHKHALESVDRTLCDLLSSDAPFGGITVVLGGDFWQVLPVVRRSSRAQIVSASLKFSQLRKDVEVHRLKTNMRVMGLEGSDVNEQVDFAKFLLRVGDGREETCMHHDLESICLPDNMCLGIQNLDDLISFTFPNILENYREVDFWKNRAILTALNDDVETIAF
ncbi:hypothetical protein O6H91_23G053500 [Diphasiastrum complanatum]|uniref:Uncharacterized protein n=1 Tax=Diphasiastrum complanatum TaxID=34168 RepID=A0ACC2AAR1_DIPCM|nr:hypothetical protein O6H91_23G053500 [Diphasiastrum complanatum]